MAVMPPDFTPVKPDRNRRFKEESRGHWRVAHTFVSAGSRDILVPCWRQECHHNQQTGMSDRNVCSTWSGGV